MPSTAPDLSLVDLFAGCGGLSLGMENAGFTPVFVSELNKDAMETYLTNRHHLLGGRPFAELAHLRCHDAHELQGERLERLVADLEELGIKLPDRGEVTGTSELDLLAGGPPCQGYSGMGHRRSYSVDKREIPSNQLYQRMAAVIRRLRPRIFLFENVRGLLTSRWRHNESARIWPDVLQEFRSIPGYTVRWSLVRARDYGVPQNRPRVLLVGVRDDVVEHCLGLDPGADTEDAVKCGFLPPGEPSGYPDLEDLLDDLVDTSVAKALVTGRFPTGDFQTTRYPSPARTPIQRLLRSPPPAHGGKISAELTEHEYSRHRPEVVAKFMYMLANGGVIPEYARTKKFSQRVLPRRWGNQRPSITAASLPDDYVHYSQPRTLSVREWARLQLFPDWYQFKGKRTTGGIRRAGNPREGIFDRDVPKYTQIGNAVPVGLAERVGIHFRRILKSEFDIKLTK
jgi:DNA (cytosine-5)-methyltransferase 1